MAEQFLGLVCDRMGCVQSVLRDDLGALSGIAPGAPLASCLASSSLEKFFGLLAELQREGVAYGWGLTFMAGGKETLVHLSGALYGDMVLLLAGDHGEVEWLSAELNRVNADQVKHLREMLKQRAPVPGDVNHVTEDRLAAIGNELAALHRDLGRSSRELASQEHERDLLVAMLAHDLRSPLTTISGNTAMLIEATDPEDERAPLLADVGSACAHLSRLVHDTLSWVQLDHGQVQLQREPLNVALFVRPVLRSHRHEAEAQGVHLHADLPPDLPEVQADPVRLRQVLDNLLSNAIRFSPREGRVTLAASSEEDTFTLEVRDEGPGMPAEVQEQVFHPFQSGGQADSGFGLGLAIVQRLVELHGGEVSLHSAPGQGTRVSCRLPLG